MNNFPDPSETQVHDEAAVSDTDQPVPTIERYKISSYGADYPVDSLAKRLTSDPDDTQSDIYVPDFQRGFIWTVKQCNRFIESLLLGLPILGIFLSRNEESKKHFIIDDSQRLRTIKAFYDGLLFGKEFVLTDVHPDFAGHSYKTLPDSDKRILNDTIIHITFVQQDSPEGSRSIYYLFERINTGGTPAQPHEVRKAIYPGSLNQLLIELDDDVHWRNIYGPKSKRFKDQELILRFLALYEEWELYKGFMKDFLNDYMGRNCNLPKSNIRPLESIFRHTCEVVDVSFRSPFRPERTLNAAIYDAVMVGIAQRLTKGQIVESDRISDIYTDFLSNSDFDNSTTIGTSQSANVKKRISMAINTFANVS